MQTQQTLSRWFLVALLLATVGLWARPSQGQIPILGGMLDPAIDEPGKPFSYFWHPTDVIGALYDPVASEVTPEGYLYTGFGELMFFVGVPPEPVNVRIKTLHKGYLPIVEYDFCRHDVHYTVRMFAADLGGKLQGLPVNFVEVRLENNAVEQRAALFSSAYRYSPPINNLGNSPAYRFGQNTGLIANRYTEGQMPFNANWQYSFGPGAVIRDGRLLYTFPRTPEPEQFTVSLADKGFQMYRFFTGDMVGNRDPKQYSNYDTPMGVVTYRVTLKPHESRTLAFKMPLAPLPIDSAEARQVLEADSAQQFERTVSFWENLVGKRAPLRFPETKVQEALLANTVFDLLAIDKIGENYITNVNKFQYHAFCGGANPSHMRVGFDYMGLDEIARKTMLYSIAFQLPDGSFDQRPNGSPYYEFLGCNLWCIGRHYQLTRDDSFLRQVYPGVVKAMEYVMRTTQKDPLGLFPPYVGIADDAALNGVRQTGPHLITLYGMPQAIAMAKAMGKADDVRRFEAEQQRFRAALEKQLALQTAKTGGWIPPGLEKTLLGNHWDNMMLLYPEPLFDPFDARVTATIRKSRETYAEGILGYVLPLAIDKKGDDFVFNTQPGLHYWHTPDNAENALVRGSDEDQQWAVKDLYALLLHTTSTHAPQEFSTLPWSTRDYYANDILPDGAASGKIIELMRNMLVREYRSDLYLFSAVSPDWLRPGKKIEIAGEPTAFGPVSAVLSAGAEGWEVQLSPAFRQPPRQIVIRVPWFYEVQSAEADGHVLPVTEGKLVVVPGTRQLKVKGRFKPSAPAWSFERTVAEYQQEYRRRYADFLRTGTIQP